MVLQEDDEDSVDSKDDELGRATKNGCYQGLMTVIRKRQLGFLGHILRRSGMEKNCLLGMVEGSRARGRQRMKWMDKIKELAGCERMNEMLRLDEDRSDWRAIVASINIDTALR